MKWIDYFLCFRKQRVVVNGVKTDCAPVLSDVPQGIVLGPLSFSLYINDISSAIESEIRLFADDCVCYREIKDEEDTIKLQRDNDRLGSWARKWGMSGVILIQKFKHVRSDIERWSDIFPSKIVISLAFNYEMILIFE